MNRHLLFVVIAFAAALGMVSCTLMFEVDTQKLQEEIYDPTAVKYPVLEQSMVLYLDHSTCVINANLSSPVFRALKGQLGLYTDTLCLVKGRILEYVSNTDKSPTSTDVFNIINEIRDDIPFADIGQAIGNICNGSSQAIFITDCEYFDRNGRNQDGYPYLSGAFKDWIKKGYVIYVVTEPYQERYRGRTYDKKRFYFIFTDDKMQAPISGNMLNELQSLLQNGVCKLFKITNSDIMAERKGEMVENDLTFTFESLNGFEYAAIDDDWNSIREFVMKLDKYGEPIPEEKPAPLIKNLVFNDGNNYFIDDMEVVATNITARYLSIDCDAADGLKLDCTDLKPDDVDMSEGFMLDKDALRSRKLNVFLTDKVFNYLLPSEYGGNLIRLDFVVTKAGLQNYDSDMFLWKSLYEDADAICVATSIDNVLHDVGIVPMSKDRRVIHTVFIKTEAYN
jgi:hypothetical protein